MRTLTQLIVGFVPPRLRKRLHMESSSRSPPMAANRPSSPDSEGTSESSAVPKTRSKFGAFKTSLKEVGQRVGGRAKPADPEAAAVKAKEKEKKKVKKVEKKNEKGKASKRESGAEDSPLADGSEATPSPPKSARTSKASTLVRKLSIGRYKSEGRSSKTPTPEASPSASSASSRPAPDGEDLSSPGTPPTPTVHQPEPFLPDAADQSRDIASAAEGPVTDSHDVVDPQPTTPDTAAIVAELVQAKIWNLTTPEPAADYSAQQQWSEPVSKDAGAAEAEPNVPDVSDLRAPPLVASVSATVRDVAASLPVPLAREEELDQFGEVEEEFAQSTDPEEPESERITAAGEDAQTPLPVSGAEQEERLEQREQEEPSAPPQPEEEPLREAAEEKPQTPPQDPSPEGSQQGDIVAEPLEEQHAAVLVEQEAEPADSYSEAEDCVADMSQRRSRKRQSGTAALSPGAADGPDAVADSSLPSLKAELASADRDRQRESDASVTFLDAERADGVLPNGTGDQEFAPAEGDEHMDATSIGDAIAEARSKLTESLGAAAAAAAQQAPSAVAQQLPEKREHLYKILVIGELGTGKTSIIKRYVHQFFSQHYRATIGVDFALKVLNWDSNTIIRLQMWDIAGQERFGNMTRVYYKEAVGAFIVFDVTRVATFDAVMKWKLDLDSKVTLQDGSPIPCVLLANKCDQPKEGLANNPAKMEEYCKEKGFTAWYETSAKENINIDEAARTLVKKILQNDQLINQNDTAKDTEKIALDGKASESKSGGRCSC